MGTHDLDSIKGPFTYEALPPKEIKFAPLNSTKVMNGEELMHYYDVGYLRSICTTCDMDTNKTLQSYDRSKLKIDPSPNFYL